MKEVGRSIDHIMSGVAGSNSDCMKAGGVRSDHTIILQGLVQTIEKYWGEVSQRLQQFIGGLLDISPV